MFSLVWEREIFAKAFEEGFIEGYIEGRREQALVIFKRLLAMNMPEAQARAMAFGQDETLGEDRPEIDPQKTPELWG